MEPPGRSFGAPEGKLREIRDFAEVPALRCASMRAAPPAQALSRMARRPCPCRSSPGHRNFFLTNLPTGWIAGVMPGVIGAGSAVGSQAPRWPSWSAPEPGQRWPPASEPARGSGTAGAGLGQPAPEKARPWAARPASPAPLAAGLRLGAEHPLDERRIGCPFGCRPLACRRLLLLLILCGDVLRELGVVLGLLALERGGKLPAARCRAGRRPSG